MILRLECVAALTDRYPIDIDLGSKTQRTRFIRDDDQPRSKRTKSSAMNTSTALDCLTGSQARKVLRDVCPTVNGIQRDVFPAMLRIVGIGVAIAPPSTDKTIMNQSQ